VGSHEHGNKLPYSVKAGNIFTAVVFQDVAPYMWWIGTQAMEKTAVSIFREDKNQTCKNSNLMQGILGWATGKPKKPNGLETGCFLKEVKTIKCESKGGRKSSRK